VLFILLNSFITLLVVWAGLAVITGARRAVHGGVPDHVGIHQWRVSPPQDAILFYVFFEAMLIPMYLIIGIWGGPNRVYAAIKFFLYTLLGSLLMLVAFIFLYQKSGSFALQDWYELPLSMKTQMLIFIAFFRRLRRQGARCGRSIRGCRCASRSADGGSVVLAAVTLKIGAYGFVRFILPILPDASRSPQVVGFIDHAVADRRRLHRLRRAGAGRHEAADRLFVDLAHGLRDARLLPLQRAGHGGRPGADDLARLRFRGMFLCVGVLY
jgi:NADH-quinone oxidoreductase subunit M